MDKRDKNFIIDDVLNLVFSYFYFVTEFELEKKRNEKKIIVFCLGNIIDWVGKLFGEMIVFYGNMLLFEIFFCVIF